MKIPIDIRVHSERIYSDISRRHAGEERPETDDFRVSGTMKTTKGGYRIEFSEDDDRITTLIDVWDGDKVSVTRLGEMNSHMVFSDGKAYTCICNTGFFPLQMRIRTKSLNNTISFEGGKLDIDYTVEIVGNLAERNKLSFSVSPDKSIIKS